MNVIARIYPILDFEADAKASEAATQVLIEHLKSQKWPGNPVKPGNREILDFLPGISVYRKQNETAWERALSAALANIPEGERPKRAELGIFGDAQGGCKMWLHGHSNCPIACGTSPRDAREKFAAQQASFAAYRVQTADAAAKKSTEQTGVVKSYAGGGYYDHYVAGVLVACEKDES